MKPQYFQKEFKKSLTNLEELCVESINLIRILKDSFIGINWWRLSLSNRLLTRRDRKNLSISIFEIEKELYRLKIILRELEKKNDFKINLENKIKEREEGYFITSLKGWKVKNMKKTQEKILILYRFIKSQRL